MLVERHRIAIASTRALVTDGVLWRFLHGVRVSSGAAQLPPIDFPNGGTRIRMRASGAWALARRTITQNPGSPRWRRAGSRPRHPGGGKICGWRRSPVPYRLGRRRSFSTMLPGSSHGVHITPTIRIAAPAHKSAAACLSEERSSAGSSSGGSAFGLICLHGDTITEHHGRFGATFGDKHARSSVRSVGSRGGLSQRNPADARNRIATAGFVRVRALQALEATSMTRPWAARG